MEQEQRFAVELAWKINKVESYPHWFTVNFIEVVHRFDTDTDSSLRNRAISLAYKRLLDDLSDIGVSPYDVIIHFERIS